MAYVKQTWANGVSGGTPLSAARLNHIEDGIEGIQTDFSAIPSDRGLVAWTASISLMSATSVLATAGTVYLRRICRVPAGPVTNIVLCLAVGGSVLTAGQCFTALYTAGGVLVGQSADQSTAWATSGVKTAALTGGPFTLTAGDYYIAAWFNGTTGPSPIRDGTVITAISNVGLVAPNLATASSSTSVTTTAPNPFGAQTAFNLEWWAALS